jgi:AcrR family transcriptional regulator
MSRSYGGLTADERVALRRAKLLDAGLELFGTRGYDGTGVRDVCRAAGLTDRYFYESFTGTRELFVAVFDSATESLFSAVAEAVLAAEPDPESQLRAAIGAFVRRLAADPRVARIVFSEAGGAGAEVEQHLRGTLRRFTGLVAATARPHLDGADDDLVTVVALSLVGTLEQVIVAWQDGHLDADEDRIVELVVALFATFFAGVRPPRAPGRR